MKVTVFGAARSYASTVNAATRHQPLLEHAAVAGTDPRWIAQTALRAGAALWAVVAATDCLFAMMTRGGVLVAVQGVTLTGLGAAAAARPDVAARVLCPRGRIVLLAASFATVACIDHGFYDHYNEVAEALLCIATLVGGTRRVGMCLAVSVLGYLGSLLVAGSTPRWMLGEGHLVVVGELVTLAVSALVGLVLITLLRRFLAGAPQRVAAVREGGPSLTPQLALAARWRRPAELPRADVRMVVAPLTRNEAEVLASLARGRVPKQAARELCIALPTVRSRIAAAKRKTGARTLEQLVALYVEAERAA